MKRLILPIVGVLAALVIGGCTPAADKANQNLTKAAENFEVARRIAFDAHPHNDEFLTALAARKEKHRG